MNKKKQKNFVNFLPGLVVGPFEDFIRTHYPWIHRLAAVHSKWKKFFASFFKKDASPFAYLLNGRSGRGDLRTRGEIAPGLYAAFASWISEVSRATAA